MAEAESGTPSTRPGRLAVGVVGVGRVGAVLAAALAAAGHRVTSASAASESSLARADAMLPGAEIVAPQEVVAAADLALLAVPDDVLPDLVHGLVEVGVVRNGQLIAHTSGRHGLDVLEPVLAVGALPLALHPVTALTGTSLDLGRLTGCCFGVTAPEALRPIAEALVIEMGGEPVWITEATRPLYHAAVTMGSDHLVTLLAQAADLLAEAGVTDPARLLEPLVRACVDQALNAPESRPTPFARGDASTVTVHREVLDVTAREAGPVYVALARLAADRALAAGALSPDQAESLLDALAGPTD